MKVYHKAMPTGGDVERLIHAFGLPVVGTVIKHEELLDELEFESKSYRYRTVICAWKAKLLRDYNIDMKAVPGVGYQSLDAEQRISAGLGQFRSGTKLQLKGATRANRAVTNDPVLQRKQMLMARTAAAIQETTTEMFKQIEPPQAHKSLPWPVYTEEGATQ